MDPERIKQLRERYSEYRLDGADRDVFEMLYAIEHLQRHLDELRATPIAAASASRACPKCGIAMLAGVRPGSVTPFLWTCDQCGATVLNPATRGEG